MSEREDIERRLYEACLSGSVAELDALTEKYQLILDRVNSFTCFFNETPLHVAALRGHLDLTKALLIRNSKLAFELDSVGCLPLHLASTKGHFEIVRELVKVNNNACLARDQDDRTPLHLAAIKGRVEVIRELLRAKPESIHEKLDRGETVLHLCVKYNRLEALKTLVEDLRDNDKFLLSSRDDDGNTTLHLAAALKQMNTIKYLLEIKSVKDYVNVKNRSGFTALDVIEHYPNRDLKSMEILQFLQQAGVRRSDCNLKSPPEDCPPPPPEDCPPPPEDCPPPPPLYHCVRKVRICIIWFWMKFFWVDSSWFKEVRGHLITAATLTATMAYQAILSPPGGLWQDDKVVNSTGQAAPPVGGFWQEENNEEHKAGQAAPPVGGFWQEENNEEHKAGQAILDSRNYSYCAKFLRLNSVVLFASLCTIMLALSELPYSNELVRLMIFTMYITFACMAIAYLLALSQLFPNQVDYSDLFGGIILAWTSALGFVAVLHACRFLIRLVRMLVCLVKKCAKLVGRKFSRRKNVQRGPNNHTTQNSATTSDCCFGKYC